MADRRIDEDDSEPSHRRQYRLPTSSTSRSSGSRSGATQSSQPARSSLSTAAESRDRASTSQSQQARRTAVGPQHASGSRRGESSGYRAGKLNSKAMAEDDDDSSEDQEDEDEDEDDSDDNDEQREPSTSSRQRRSDSIITSEDIQSLQERARAAVKHLTQQGYPEDQAVAAVRQKFKDTLGSDLRGDTHDDSLLRDRLPGPFKGALSWKGRDLRRGVEIVTLGSSDIKQLKIAIAQYKAMGGTASYITRDNFPLSSDLQKKLRDVSREVHQGRGFVTLRGLDKADFDDENTEDSTIAFAGIAAHVCPSRAVSTFCGVNLAMEHVYDARAITNGIGGPPLPPTKLPSMLHFHADRFNGDVLAMYVRHPGIGDEGQQYLASFPTIYNQLRQDYPKVLQILGSANWPFLVKPSMNQDPYILESPVMFFNGSNIPICQLVLEPLLGEPLLPRPPNARPLSQDQEQAIKLVHQIANENRYELSRHDGDIQFINNLGTLHARNKYNDTGSDNGRHLLRMFLRDAQYAWPKPANWAPYFDKPFSVPYPGALVDHWDREPRRYVFFHG